MSSSMMIPVWMILKKTKLLYPMRLIKSNRKKNLKLKQPKKKNQYQSKMKIQSQLNLLRRQKLERVSSKDFCKVLSPKNVHLQQL